LAVAEVNPSLDSLFSVAGATISNERRHHDERESFLSDTSGVQARILETDDIVDSEDEDVKKIAAPSRKRAASSISSRETRFL